MILRGMIISDRDYARRLLERTGYYRLSAFYYPFRTFCVLPEEGQRIRCDRFRNGTTFDEVAAFYLWDKQIRLMVIDAIERIEIAIRACIVDILGAINKHGHRDPRSYKPSIREPVGDATALEKFTDKLSEGFKRSKEEYAKHYRDRYLGNPPIWVEAGTWDWGNMAFILQHLHDKHKEKIAAKVHPNLPFSKLESWVNALNTVRNDCAHHSRIWNKNLVNSPGLPKGPAFTDFDHIKVSSKKGATPTQKLYGVLVVIAFLLQRFHPNTKWHCRLREMALEAKGKLPSEVGLASAGFPDGWDNQEIWRR